jgi:hypothetical protein
MRGIVKMYRLSDELAKLILSKSKAPNLESTGDRAFMPKSFDALGIIDPMVAIGTDFHYILESPIPIVYPDLPSVPVGVKSYFLYKKEELMQPIMEEWLVNEAMINPHSKDVENEINVADCAIMLPSDIEKLTAKEVKTLERLIELEPMILDCLNLGKKG